MLPVQPYQTGRYPPAGPQWVQFGDDIVEHTLTAAEKRANRRQNSVNIHYERLHQRGLIPMKVREPVPRTEMDTQTENFTADASTQWERRRDATGKPLNEDSENEDPEVDQGGERGNGGSSSSTTRGTKGVNLIQRASTGASSGLKHGLSLGYGLGAVGGALATAAGYAAGFGGGATVGGIQGAGTVIGNAMFEGAGEDLFGGSPTPEPLAVKPKEVDHQQHNPAEPVPPYLLDLAEREAAAKKTSLVVGQWGSKQQDKKRLDKQKIEDDKAARKREAEELIAKHR